MPNTGSQKHLIYQRNSLYTTHFIITNLLKNNYILKREAYIFYILENRIKNQTNQIKHSISHLCNNLHSKAMHIRKQSQNRITLMIKPWCSIKKKKVCAMKCPQRVDKHYNISKASSSLNLFKLQKRRCEKPSSKYSDTVWWGLNLFTLHNLCLKRT